MDGAFHLSGNLPRPAFRVRIIRTPDFDDLSLLILDHVHASNDVGIAQPHLLAGREPKVFFRRIFTKIFPLDVKDAGKRNRPTPHRGIFRVIHRLDFLHLAFRVIGNDDAKGPEYRHDPLRTRIQVLPDEMLQQVHLHHAVALRHPDMLAKTSNRLRRIPAASQAHQRGQTRIIPSGHVPLLDEPQQLALAHDRVRQAQAREFNLLGMAGHFTFVEQPIVQRTMVLKLQGAEGMRYPFEGIGQGMREIIRGINVPIRSRPVMRHPPDPVQRGVTHVDIG